MSEEPWDGAQHRAAAVITFLRPGLRFFHEGQMDGRTVHVSMHLGRRPPERADPQLREFYRRLLGALRRGEAHQGDWRLCACREAWAGNPTFDQFVAMTWQAPGGRLLAAVNYGPNQGQCYAQVPLGMRGGVILRDLLSEATYRRDGEEMASKGLYLDMPPFGHHLFAIEQA